VLHRDRFKCMLCGDHPARNAECVLHVDHVIPWSKGGKTSEDNLRTLCATCNVGRGNRFAD
jgi:5-methylcytosine-specific restriction endonuclease McrA